MKNTTLKEFFDWYKSWYKPIESKMNIIFSVPNELHLQEFRMLMVEENVVVLELFEKIDQGIDAKPYMQQICDKADELGVAIYLEPMPRYKYFRNNIEKRKKVGKEYLKEYYARFGFELTTDKRFMKRTPKMNNAKEFYTRTYADGTEQRFSVEDYEKNVLPTLSKGGKFHLGGDMSKHLAPNGKPSNLTHEQWHLVRTPAFKAWFGDWEEAYRTGNYEGVSKVLDENFEPLVVYHGTKKEFNVFGTEEKIKFYLPEYRHLYEWKKNTNYFHRNIEYAKVFGSKYGGYENPYFLNIRNLIEVETHDDIEDIGYWENIYNYYTKEMNGDGIYSNDGQFATLLSPTQIKLADGTNTTFDGSNPDIRFELGGIYHGSPHKFEKFSTEYMGTGEGEQAFGWGLYFTSLKAIAKNYAKQLSKRSFNGTNTMPEEDVNKLLNKNIRQTEFEEIRDRNIERIRRILNNIPKLERLGYIEKGVKNPMLAGYGKQLYDLDLNSLLKAKTVNDIISSRNLYTVTLHKGKTPDQYTWLEWDKPLKKEFILNSVLSEIRKIDEKTNSLRDFQKELSAAQDDNYYKQNLLNYSGEDFYNRLSQAIGQKEASLLLLRAGIDGIKYPAESIARGATSDTARGFNYVVFDADAVTIEEIQQFSGGGEMDEDESTPPKKEDRVSMLLEKFFGLYGNQIFSGYGTIKGVKVRIKDHLANWDNFYQYDLHNLEEGDSPYLLSVVVNDDWDKFAVAGYSGKSYKNVEDFEIEYENEFPDLKAKELVFGKDDTLEDIISAIEFEIDYMNKGKQFAKGGQVKNLITRFSQLDW